MMLKMSSPILIKLIVDFMQAPLGSDGGMYYGLSLVLGYIIIDIFSALLEEQAAFYEMMLGKFLFIHPFLGIKAKNALVCK